MHPLHRNSIAELCAEHLRKGLRSGRWREMLPGVARLAAEFDVSRDTIRAALRLLEAEGLLSAQGLGRCRSITAQAIGHRTLRVGMLLHDDLSDEQNKVGQVLLQIERDVRSKDHELFYLPKTQVQLGHDVGRITRMLGQHPADAWILVAGSYELLKWSTLQLTPCFALYGRALGLPVASVGPDKLSAYVSATRRLLELGHRRIVLIARKARRLPIPGKTEQAFLDELALHGVFAGDFNLPSWEETPEGFHQLLESLFRLTPPTAMIISETAQFIATMEFLARRRLHVPEQVSLVATGDDPAFAWCHSGIAHIKSDSKPMVRHVVRWVLSVKKGLPDRKPSVVPAQFIDGGSIGPAWKG
jgi:DNA-binding LacI/PurR family transcriptional regulator